MKRVLKSSLKRIYEKTLPMSLGNTSFEKPRIFTSHYPHIKNGGPNIRTRRLAKSFGNHVLNPNIIYLNSAGTISFDYAKSILSRNRKMKVVLNQNGVFFPAWYRESDLGQKNSEMAELAQLADLVLFQSNFCEFAFRQWVDSNLRGKILYNASPDFGYKKRTKANKIKIGISAAIFNTETLHFLEPLFDAIKILNSNHLQFHMFGKIDPEIYKTSDLLQLVEKNRIVVQPSYRQSNIFQAHEDLSLALHLKDKDPCPNAVVERLSMGLGHVYIDSGGTPELIGDSGISVDAPNGEQINWLKLHRIDSNELAEKIETAVAQIQELGEKARTRYEVRFTWEHYVSQHQAYFEQLLTHSDHIRTQYVQPR